MYIINECHKTYIKYTKHFPNKGVPSTLVMLIQGVKMIQDVLEEGQKRSMCIRKCERSA